MDQGLFLDKSPIYQRYSFHSSNEKPVVFQSSKTQLIAQEKSRPASNLNQNSKNPRLLDLRESNAILDRYNEENKENVDIGNLQIRKNF